MLGWWISVYAMEPAQYAKADNRQHLDIRLASWETRPGGIGWLDILVEQGKVTQFRADGYPSHYTGRAGDILPLFAEGLPDYGVPSDKAPKFPVTKNNVIVHDDRIAACPASQMLTIEVWDLS